MMASGVLGSRWKERIGFLDGREVIVTIVRLLRDKHMHFMYVHSAVLRHGGDV